MDVIGQRVLECNIVELLGTGPHGSVYRAAAEDGSREIAVKIANEPLNRGPDQQRLQAALRDLQLIRNRHVARILWTGSIDGQIAWARELGQDDVAQHFSVAVKMKSSERTAASRVSAILAAVDQAAAGLEALHRHGIVHGHLIPANLLAFAGGRFAIADGGLPCEIAPRSGRSDRTVFVAPELAATAAASPRSDLFSVGALLYYLFSGRFPGRVPRGGGARSHAGDIVPLESLAPELPSALLKLTHRLLHERPDQRLASAADLRDAIRDIAGHGPEQARARAAALGVEPRFVGRLAELADLQQLVDRARSGLPQLAVVHGAEGSGRRALLRQAVEQQLDGWRVIWPAAGEAGLLPGSALRPLIRQLARTAAASTGGSKLRTMVAAWLPDLKPFLRPPSERPGKAAPARGQREQSGAVALAAILTHLARVQPVAVILDRITAMDKSSFQAVVETLRILLEQGRQKAPLAVIVAAAPANEDARTRQLLELLQQRDQTGTSIPLGPLTRGDIRQIAQDLTGAQALSSNVLEALEELSGGLPAPASSLIRLLSDEGALRPRPRTVAEAEAERDKLQRHLSDLRTAAATDPDIPFSVTVLAGRLALLPGETRELLELAAVAGEQIDPRQLARAANRSTADVLRQLKSAADRGLVRRGRGAGSGLEFSQSALRLLLLNGLSEVRRRACHAALFDELRRHGIQAAELGRAAAHAAGAKFHAETIELGNRWAMYLREQYLFAEALDQISSVHAALSALHPDGIPPDDPRLIKAMDIQLHCEIGLRDMKAVAATCLRLDELPQRSANPRLSVMALWGHGVVASGQGQMGEAERYYRQAFDTARRAGLKQPQAEVANYLGVFYFRAAKFSEARRCHRLSFRLSKEVGDQLQCLANLQNIAAIDYMETDFEQALAGFDRLAAIYEKTRSWGSLAGILNNIGLVQLRFWRMTAARAALDRGLELGERYRLFDVLTAIHSTSARWHRELGDLDQAARELNQAISFSHHYGDIGQHARITVALADLQAARGDKGAARAGFRRGESLWRQLGADTGAIYCAMKVAQMEAPLDPESARTRIAELWAKFPEDDMLTVQFHIGTALVLKSMGLFSEAFAQYAKVLNLDNADDCDEDQIDYLLAALELARETGSQPDIGRVTRALSRQAANAARGLPAEDLALFRRTRLGAWLEQSAASDQRSQIRGS